MEARSNSPSRGLVTGLALAFALCITADQLASAQILRKREHVAQSPNFIVFASSPQWAAQVAQTAEQHRRDLAMHWLGRELPQWSQRCPLHVHSSPNMLAGGETRYSLGNGHAGDWMMSVQGTPERILDSVLPHEITHTIFACHFARLDKYMPRWADEGACTTVEHVSEKRKHEAHLQSFLRAGRGLAFNHMFQLKEYPEDILPLYAQGHSAVSFLISQSGPREFVKFVEAGMRTEDWNAAIQQHYAYTSIGDFQTQWNRWLANGSPENKIAYAPLLQQGQSDVMLAADGSHTNAGLLAGDAPEDGKIRFAIHDQTAQNSGSPQINRTTAADPSGNVSWYERRLRETTGESPPRYNGRPDGRGLPPANAGLAASSLRSTSAAGRRPEQHSLARPQPMQHNGIRVIDWGNQPPVQGVQTGQPAAASQPPVAPSDGAAPQVSPSQYSAAPAMVPLYR